MQCFCKRITWVLRGISTDMRLEEVRIINSGNGTAEGAAQTLSPFPLPRLGEEGLLGLLLGPVVPQSWAQPRL